MPAILKKKKFALTFVLLTEKMGGDVEDAPALKIFTLAKMVKLVVLLPHVN